MNISKHSGRVSILALFAVLSLGISACATKSEPLPAASSVSGEEARATAELLAPLDISQAANIMFVDTETLAKTSDVIVVGTISEWLLGDQVSTETGMDIGATILAVIKVSEVSHQAEGVAVAPGDVLYAIVLAPFEGREEIIASLPTGLETVAYLEGPLTSDDLTVADDLDVEPGDAKADGEDRWITTPQGFIVTAPSDSTFQIWPSLGSAQTGELREALPGGTLDGLTEAQRRVAEANVADLEARGVDPSN